MDYQDYYKTLGVVRDASPDEIRKAYRKMAMRYHPDRNPGDKQAEEQFKRINEAYQVLSDPQKRAHYDRLGASYNQWRSSGGRSGDFKWDDFFTGRPGARVDYGGGVDDIFSDFFQAIFGGLGGAPRGRARSAPGVQVAAEISLDEAFHGTTRQVQAPAGRRIEVRIPAGVKTGSKVRVAGGAGTSDLYLLIEVADDPRFERDGDDLRAHVDLPVFTAILGGEAEVVTMTGKVKLSIPPGTQPEQVFRIAGRGMPHIKDPSKRGDLYVRVRVRIPRQLSPKQRELIEEASRIKF